MKVQQTTSMLAKELHADPKNIPSAFKDLVSYVIHNIVGSKLAGLWKINNDAIHLSQQTSHDRTLYSKQLRIDESLNEVPLGLAKVSPLPKKTLKIVKKKKEITNPSKNNKFPIYDEIPATNFSCNLLKLKKGYYADTEAGCQVYHYCHEDGRQDSFLCPKGTIFNLNVTVCDWWYNAKCSGSKVRIEATNTSTIYAQSEEKTDFSNHIERFSRSNINEQSDFYYYDYKSNPEVEDDYYYDDYDHEYSEYSGDEYDDSQSYYDEDNNIQTTEIYKNGFIDLFATTTPTVSPFEALALANKKPDISVQQQSNDLKRRQEIILQRQKNKYITKQQELNARINAQNRLLSLSTPSPKNIERRQSVYTSDLNRSTMFALQNHNQQNQFNRQENNRAHLLHNQHQQGHITQNERHQEQPRYQNIVQSKERFQIPRNDQQQLLHQQGYIAHNEKQQEQPYYQHLVQPKPKINYNGNGANVPSQQQYFHSVPVNTQNYINNREFSIVHTTPKSFYQNNEHTPQNIYQRESSVHSNKDINLNYRQIPQYQNTDNFRSNNNANFELPNQKPTHYSNQNPRDVNPYSKDEISIQWRPKATSGFVPGYEPSPTDNPMLSKINTNNQHYYTQNTVTQIPKAEIHPTLLVDLAARLYSEKDEVNQNQQKHLHKIGKNCYAFEESGVSLIGGAERCIDGPHHHHQHESSLESPKAISHLLQNDRFRAQLNQPEIITADPLSLPSFNSDPKRPIRKKDDSKIQTQRNHQERIHISKQIPRKESSTPWSFRQFSLIRNIFGV
nr:TPR-containing protein DDB_G0280363-like [Lepeophtheirus salmonis]